jgi:cell wall-associated NlpC family hydrolase
MTFQQFLDRYNGAYIDYDGAYGYQCVDLMRQYIKDVFGVNPYIALPPNSSAKQIYKAYTFSTPYKKIANTPTAIPKNGDIIFWGYYPGVTGWAGHVAIVVGDGASVNNFISFDQNWPSRTACHRQLHNYKGVMGWLRKV